MDQTTHRVPPGFVWPTVGHPGRVPLWALAPNPNQPRTDAGFEDEELGSLAETMDPAKGGEQREILTVRELHESEFGLYSAYVRYIIISGERRWRSAYLAGLAELEIRVKRYGSQADEEFDMYMLNEKRVGLSDIENARYLGRIMRNYNLSTQEELAEKVGKTGKDISQFLSLLKLSPKVQGHMSPKVPEYARLKRQVGIFLSHLEHGVQDDFVERMPKDRATAGQQIRWMQRELKDKSIHLPTKRANPSDLRDIISYFAVQVERRASELTAKPNLGRLFENAKEDQLQDLLGKLGDAEYEFNELLNKVRALAGVAAKEDVAVPERPLPVREEFAPPPPPTPRMVPVQAVVTVPDKPRPVLKERPPEPKTPPLNYYDRRKGSWVRGVSVTMSRYIELWEDERIEFQMLDREKPGYLPTLEEARARLAQFNAKS